MKILYEDAPLTSHPMHSKKAMRSIPGYMGVIPAKIMEDNIGVTWEESKCISRSRVARNVKDSTGVQLPGYAHHFKPETKDRNRISNGILGYSGSIPFLVSENIVGQTFSRSKELAYHACRESMQNKQNFNHDSQSVRSSRTSASSTSSSNLPPIRQNTTMNSGLFPRMAKAPAWQETVSDRLEQRKVREDVQPILYRLWNQ